MQRSKVTALPMELREQLDQKLIAGSFSDYKGLEAWLGEQGFRISRGSLQRYGSAFERKMKTISIATKQAHALAEASPDREGAMTDALVRLVQEKIFSVLVEAEDIEDGHLRASRARSRTWAARTYRRSAGRKRCANGSTRRSAPPVRRSMKSSAPAACRRRLMTRSARRY